MTSVPAPRAGVNADVLIVGAGPAGLAAAIELRRLGAGSVLVADREEMPARSRPLSRPALILRPLSWPVRWAPRASP